MDSAWPVQSLRRVAAEERNHEDGEVGFSTPIAHR